MGEFSEKMIRATTEELLFENEKIKEELMFKNQIITSQRLELNRYIKAFHYEQLTILEPLWRHCYSLGASMLRWVMPRYWVEQLKRFIPSPDRQGVNIIRHLSPDRFPLIDPEQLKKSKEESCSDIYIFSIIDWEFRKQRPQHLAIELAQRGYRVFYIEMELTHNVTSVQKIANNLFRVQFSQKKIGRLKPYSGCGSLALYKRYLEEFLLFCRKVGSKGTKQVIVQHPFWWDLIKLLPSDFKITYDCMDEIAGFSNTTDKILDNERELVRQCDKLVVTSSYLQRKYKHISTGYLIRNGVSEAIFSQLTNTNNTVKQDEEDCKIAVGYLGAIEEWFDYDLVFEVAKNNPEFVFHICGSLTSSNLKNNGPSNIIFYGEIGYSDVPQFLNSMDVMMIPFRMLPIIEACDPVKFYEYSAMGKPTVSTYLPELFRFKDVVFFAATALDFSVQIIKAYNSSRSVLFQESLQVVARNNTWSMRCDQLCELLSNND